MKYQHFKTQDEKFKNSLKEWENETRPFMRVSLNEERDEFDYKRKHEKIKKLKESMLVVYPEDEIENFSIHNSHGCVSQQGDILTGVIITSKEREWVTENGLQKKQSLS
jgi:hypothetical protein